MIALWLAGCGGDRPPPGDGDTPTGDTTDTIGVFEDLPEFELHGDVTDLVSTPELLLALSKDGTVTGYAWDGTEVGHVALEVYDLESCGLESMALDPNFATNGLAFFGACADTQTSGIYRVRLDLGAWTATDRVEILLASEPEAEVPWHNVGWIGFDAEGALLGLFGEKTISRNAADTSNVLGSIVRVLPSREPGVGGYTPHPDNPFAAGGGHDAIFAWGVRMPWTGALDDAGRLWLADVGSGADGFEELDHVQVGQDLGWPDHEGVCTDCGTSVPPVVAWPHAETVPWFSDDPEIVPTELRVGWVAPGVRAGDPDPYDGRLTGAVLYGDLCLGFVRALRLDDDGTVASDEPVGHLPAAAWATGPDGFLYASTLQGCTGQTLKGVSTLSRLVHPGAL